MSAIMAWEPHKSIANCVLALDMTRTDTYTVDTAPTPDTVTSITNRVSGVAWTEASNPPEYEAAGFNSKPSMKGNGSSRRLMSTEAAVAAAISGNDVAWSGISAITHVATGGTAIGFGNTGNNTPRGSVRSFATNQPSVAKVDDTGASNITVSHPSSVTLGDPLVLTTICYGATTSIGINDGALSTPAAQAVGQMTIDRVSLFARGRQTVDAFSSDRICETYLFSVALSRSEQLRAVSRLMAKHGI